MCAGVLQTSTDNKSIESHAISRFRSAWTQQSESHGLNKPLRFARQTTNLVQVVMRPDGVRTNQKHGGKDSPTTGIRLRMFLMSIPSNHSQRKHKYRGEVDLATRTYNLSE